MFKEVCIKINQIEKVKQIIWLLYSVHSASVFRIARD